MTKHKKQAKSHRGISRAFVVILLIIILVIIVSFLPEAIVPEKIKPGYEYLVEVRNKLTTTVKEKTGLDDTDQFGRAAGGNSVSVCSFHIPSLGDTKSKENGALAYVLREFDIVVIQGLVAPPFPMKFPDGRPVKPADEARDFFNAMLIYGFEYELSLEDTGPGERIHRNKTSTEWWVTFYKDDRVKVATDLPRGYLAGDRSNHSDYDRVPHAFAFRTINDSLDFVLVSVHLRAGSSERDTSRKKHELAAAKAWIDANNTTEKDFIVLGDMNIEENNELSTVTPFGFHSLNDECRPTNTDISSPRPNSHVMYNPLQIQELDKTFDLQIVDLIAALEELWRKEDPYPGEPYVHDRFIKYYSPYQPIVFRLTVPAKDDD